MSATFLFDRFEAEAQKQGRSMPSLEYRGAATAARFGDPEEEFEALLHGCAVYDLGYRSRIRVTGEDRVRWLNGMVTNNIRDLAVQRGVYAFLLNPQGRILGDMYVFNAGDALIAETDRSQVEKILATFDHFIIMDDVELKDTGDEQTTIGMMGPKSHEILQTAGIHISGMQPLQRVTASCSCDCGCVECSVIRGDNPLGESYEIWLDAKDAVATWRALASAGATPVGAEALERQRILAGMPLYGVDIRERDLPQETEQARALNFNKGCYVGQEIVERIRSRGSVHRTFAGFLLEPEVAMQAGAKISAEGKEAGEVTSIALLNTPLGERRIALGYIRREAGTAGQEVQIGGAKGSVVRLPLDVSALKRQDEALLHRV